MSQGKAFTPEERETIIQSLRPYLEMGFSRNKACRFIGLPPQTLSNWVVEDESLGMKLTSWENVNTALALAVIHQTIQNEKLKADEGDTRAENSWKLISKLEEGYKDKLDVTSNDKDLPTPIIPLNV
jgi:transposase-like protein